MREFAFAIKDLSGVHARPAGLLVKEAIKYKSDITIEYNGKQADAKRIFAVMGLGAKCGDILNIRINGEDEKIASENFSVFLNNNL